MNFTHLTTETEINAIYFEKYFPRHNVVQLIRPKPITVTATGYQSLSVLTLLLLENLTIFPCGLSCDVNKKRTTQL